MSGRAHRYIAVRREHGRYRAVLWLASNRQHVEAGSSTATSNLAEAHASARALANAHGCQVIETWPFPQKRREIAR